MEFINLVEVKEEEILKILQEWEKSRDETGGGGERYDRTQGGGTNTLCRAVANTDLGVEEKLSYIITYFTTVRTKEEKQSTKSRQTRGKESLPFPSHPFLHLLSIHQAKIGSTSGTATHKENVEGRLELWVSEEYAVLFRQGTLEILGWIKRTLLVGSMGSDDTAGTVQLSVESEGEAVERWVLTFSRKELACFLPGHWKPVSESLSFPSYCQDLELMPNTCS